MLKRSLTLSFLNQSSIRLWMKSCASLVALSFILPMVSWTFETNNYQPPQELTIMHMGRPISIPDRLASVQKIFTGHNKTVICIQDLHCNYEVQKNIASLIEHLVNKQRLKLITVEGASGPIDPKLIRQFPINSVKNLVSDYLVKQGKLTGADFFAATTKESKIILEGIETQSLYDKSLNTVQDFLTGETQGLIYDLRDQLDQLKPAIYSKALLKVDEIKLSYREGKFDLLTFAVKLSQQARKVNHPLEAYAQVRKFLSLNQTFFGSQINPEKLYLELDQLENNIRHLFYTTEHEKKLDEYYHRLDIMEKLLNISATQEELNGFSENREQYTIQAFLDYFNSVGAIHTHSGTSELLLLDHALNQVALFYELADERSIHFVDNLIKSMDKHKQNIAVIVNGGFHAAKVTEELQQRQLSYVSVQPKMTKVDIVNPYFELLQNRQTPLEQLLAKNQTILAVANYLQQLSKFTNMRAALGIKLSALAAFFKPQSIDAMMDQLKVNYNIENLQVFDEDQPAIRDMPRLNNTVWLHGYINNAPGYLMVTKRILRHIGLSDELINNYHNQINVTNFSSGFKVVYLTEDAFNEIKNQLEEPSGFWSNQVAAFLETFRNIIPMVMVYTFISKGQAAQLVDQFVNTHDQYSLEKKGDLKNKVMNWLKYGSWFLTTSLVAAVTLTVATEVLELKVIVTILSANVMVLWLMHSIDSMLNPQLAGNSDQPPNKKPKSSTESNSSTTLAVLNHAVENDPAQLTKDDFMQVIIANSHLNELDPISLTVIQMFINNAKKSQTTDLKTNTTWLKLAMLMHRAPDYNDVIEQACQVLTEDQQIQVFREVLVNGPRGPALKELDLHSGAKIFETAAHKLSQYNTIHALAALVEARGLYDEQFGVNDVINRAIIANVMLGNLAEQLFKAKLIQSWTIKFPRSGLFELSHPISVDELMVLRNSVRSMKQKEELHALVAELAYAVRRDQEKKKKQQQLLIALTTIFIEADLNEYLHTSVETVKNSEITGFSENDIDAANWIAGVICASIRSDFISDYNEHDDASRFSMVHSALQPAQTIANHLGFEDYLSKISKLQLATILGYFLKEEINYHFVFNTEVESKYDLEDITHDENYDQFIEVILASQALAYMVNTLQELTESKQFPEVLIEDYIGLAEKADRFDKQFFQVATSLRQAKDLLTDELIELNNSKNELEAEIRILLDNFKQELPQSFETFRNNLPEEIVFAFIEPIKVLHTSPMLYDVVGWLTEIIKLNLKDETKKWITKRIEDGMLVAIISVSFIPLLTAAVAGTLTGMALATGVFWILFGITIVIVLMSVLHWQEYFDDQGERQPATKASREQIGWQFTKMTTVCTIAMGLVGMSWIVMFQPTDIAHYFLIPAILSIIQIIYHDLLNTKKTVSQYIEQDLKPQLTSLMSIATSLTFVFMEAISDLFSIANSAVLLSSLIASYSVLVLNRLGELFKDAGKETKKITAVSLNYILSMLFIFAAFSFMPFNFVWLFIGLLPLMSIHRWFQTTSRLLQPMAMVMGGDETSSGGSRHSNSGRNNLTELQQRIVNNQPTRVIFVCGQNEKRSPIAQLLLQKELTELGKKHIEVLSAGVVRLGETSSLDQNIRYALMRFNVDDVLVGNFQSRSLRELQQSISHEDNTYIVNVAGEQSIEMMLDLELSDNSKLISLRDLGVDQDFNTSYAQILVEQIKNNIINKIIPQKSSPRFTSPKLKSFVNKITLGKFSHTTELVTAEQLENIIVGLLMTAGFVPLIVALALSATTGWMMAALATSLALAYAINRWLVVPLFRWLHETVWNEELKMPVVVTPKQLEKISQHFVSMSVIFALSSLIIGSLMLIVAEPTTLSQLYFVPLISTLMVAIYHRVLNARVTIQKFLSSKKLYNIGVVLLSLITMLSLAQNLSALETIIIAGLNGMVIWPLAIMLALIYMWWWASPQLATESDMAMSAHDDIKSAKDAVMAAKGDEIGGQGKSEMSKKEVVEISKTLDPGKEIVDYLGELEDHYKNTNERVRLSLVVTSEKQAQDLESFGFTLDVTAQKKTVATYLSAIKDIDEKHIAEEKEIPSDAEDFRVKVIFDSMHPFKVNGRTYTSIIIIAENSRPFHEYGVIEAIRKKEAILDLSDMPLEFKMETIRDAQGFEWIISEEEIANQAAAAAEAARLRDMQHEEIKAQSAAISAAEAAAESARQLDSVRELVAKVELEEARRAANIVARQKEIAQQASREATAAAKKANTKPASDASEEAAASLQALISLAMEVTTVIKNKSKEVVAKEKKTPEAIDSHQPEITWRDTLKNISWLIFANLRKYGLAVAIVFLIIVVGGTYIIQNHAQQSWHAVEMNMKREQEITQRDEAIVATADHLDLLITVFESQIKFFVANQATFLQFNSDGSGFQLKPMNDIPHKFRVIYKDIKAAYDQIEEFEWFSSNPKMSMAHNLRNLMVTFIVQTGYAEKSVNQETKDRLHKESLTLTLMHLAYLKNEIDAMGDSEINNLTLEQISRNSFLSITKQGFSLKKGINKVPLRFRPAYITISNGFSSASNLEFRDNWTFKENLYANLLKLLRLIVIADNPSREAEFDRTFRLRHTSPTLKIFVNKVTFGLLSHSTELVIAEQLENIIIGLFMTAGLAPLIVALALSASVGWILAALAASLALAYAINRWLIVPLSKWLHKTVWDETLKQPVPASPKQLDVISLQFVTMSAIFVTSLLIIGSLMLIVAEPTTLSQLYFVPLISTLMVAIYHRVLNARVTIQKFLSSKKLYNFGVVLLSLITMLSLAQNLSALETIIIAGLNGMVIWPIAIMLTLIYLWWWASPQLAVDSDMTMSAHSLKKSVRDTVMAAMGDKTGGQSEASQANGEVESVEVTLNPEQDAIAFLLEDRDLSKPRVRSIVVRTEEQAIILNDEGFTPDNQARQEELLAITTELKTVKPNRIIEINYDTLNPVTVGSIIEIVLDRAIVLKGKDITRIQLEILSAKVSKTIDGITIVESLRAKSIKVHPWMFPLSFSMATRGAAADYPWIISDEEQATIEQTRHQADKRVVGSQKIKVEVISDKPDKVKASQQEFDGRIRAYLQAELKWVREHPVTQAVMIGPDFNKFQQKLITSAIQIARPKSGTKKSLDIKEMVKEFQKALTAKIKLRQLYTIDRARSILTDQKIETVLKRTIDFIRGVYAIKIEDERDQVAFNHGLIQTALLTTTYKRVQSAISTLIADNQGKLVSEEIPSTPLAGGYFVVADDAEFNIKPRVVTNALRNIQNKIQALIDFYSEDDLDVPALSETIVAEYNSLYNYFVDVETLLTQSEPDFTQQLFWLINLLGEIVRVDSYNKWAGMRNRPKADYDALLVQLIESTAELMNQMGWGNVDVYDFFGVRSLKHTSDGVSPPRLSSFKLKNLVNKHISPIFNKYKNNPISDNDEWLVVEFLESIFLAALAGFSFYPLLGIILSSGWAAVTLISWPVALAVIGLFAIISLMLWSHQQVWDFGLNSLRNLDYSNWRDNLRIILPTLLMMSVFTGMMFIAGNMDYQVIVQWIISFAGLAGTHRILNLINEKMGIGVRATGGGSDAVMSGEIVRLDPDQDITAFLIEDHARVSAIEVTTQEQADELAGEGFTPRNQVRQEQLHDLAEQLKVINRNRIREINYDESKPFKKGTVIEIVLDRAIVVDDREFSNIQLEIMIDKVGEAPMDAGSIIASLKSKNIKVHPWMFPLSFKISNAELASDYPWIVYEPEHDEEKTRKTPARKKVATKNAVSKKVVAKKSGKPKSRKNPNRELSEDEIRDRLIKARIRVVLDWLRNHPLSKTVIDDQTIPNIIKMMGKLKPYTYRKLMKAFYELLDQAAKSKIHFNTENIEQLGADMEKAYRSLNQLRKSIVVLKANQEIAIIYNRFILYEVLLITAIKQIQGQAVSIAQDVDHEHLLKNQAESGSKIIAMMPKETQDRSNASVVDALQVVKKSVQALSDYYRDQSDVIPAMSATIGHEYQFLTEELEGLIEKFEKNHSKAEFQFKRWLDQLSALTSADFNARWIEINERDEYAYNQLLDNLIVAMRPLFEAKGWGEVPLYDYFGLVQSELKLLPRLTSLKLKNILNKITLNKLPEEAEWRLAEILESIIIGEMLIFFGGPIVGALLAGGLAAVTLLQVGLAIVGLGLVVGFMLWGHQKFWDFSIDNYRDLKLKNWRDWLEIILQTTAFVTLFTIGMFAAGSFDHHGFSQFILALIPSYGYHAILNTYRKLVGQGMRLTSGGMISNRDLGFNSQSLAIVLTAWVTENEQNGVSFTSDEILQQILSTRSADEIRSLFSFITPINAEVHVNQQPQFRIHVQNGDMILKPNHEITGSFNHMRVPADFIATYYPGLQRLAEVMASSKKVKQVEDDTKPLQKINIRPINTEPVRKIRFRPLGAEQVKPKKNNFYADSAYDLFANEILSEWPEFSLVSFANMIGRAGVRSVAFDEEDDRSRSLGKRTMRLYPKTDEIEKFQDQAFQQLPRFIREKIRQGRNVITGIPRGSDVPNIAIIYDERTNRVDRIAIHLYHSDYDGEFIEITPTMAGYNALVRSIQEQLLDINQQEISRRNHLHFTMPMVSEYQRQGFEQTIKNDSLLRSLSDQITPTSGNNHKLVVDRGFWTINDSAVSQQTTGAVAITAKRGDKIFQFIGQLSYESPDYERLYHEALHILFHQRLFNNEIGRDELVELLRYIKQTHFLFDNWLLGQLAYEQSARSREDSPQLTIITEWISYVGQQIYNVRSQIPIDGRQWSMQSPWGNNITSQDLQYLQSRGWIKEGRLVEPRYTSPILVRQIQKLNFNLLRLGLSAVSENITAQKLEDIILGAIVLASATPLVSALMAGSVALATLLGPAIIFIAGLMLVAGIFVWLHWDQVYGANGKPRPATNDDRRKVIIQFTTMAMIFTTSMLLAGSAWALFTDVTWVTQYIIMPLVGWIGVSNYHDLINKNKLPQIKEINSSAFKFNKPISKTPDNTLHWLHISWRGIQLFLMTPILFMAQALVKSDQVKWDPITEQALARFVMSHHLFDYEINELPNQASTALTNQINQVIGELNLSSFMQVKLQQSISDSGEPTILSSMVTYYIALMIQQQRATKQLIYRSQQPFVMPQLKRINRLWPSSVKGLYLYLLNSDYLISKWIRQIVQKAYPMKSLEIMLGQLPPAAQSGELVTALLNPNDLGGHYIKSIFARNKLQRQQAIMDLETAMRHKLKTKYSRLKQLQKISADSSIIRQAEYKLIDSLEFYNEFFTQLGIKGATIAKRRNFGETSNLRTHFKLPRLVLQQAGSSIIIGDMLMMLRNINHGLAWEPVGDAVERFERKPLAADTSA